MISNRADLVFGTLPDRDWCEASFTAGYGPQDKKVPLDLTVHTRKTVFHKDVPDVGPFLVVVDRLVSPDERKRTWAAAWHLETTNCCVNGRSFTADFGQDVGLFGAASDHQAAIADRRGQKEPHWQGWMPIFKSGPHEHRPIATPVVEGAYTGRHRVVTVLVPFKGGKSPVLGVEASAETNDRSYTIRFADGTERTWREPDDGATGKGTKRL